MMTPPRPTAAQPWSVAADHPGRINDAHGEPVLFLSSRFAGAPAARVIIDKILAVDDLIAAMQALFRGDLINAAIPEAPSWRAAEFRTRLQACRNALAKAGVE
jgi:hypothetical protein